MPPGLRWEKIKDPGCWHARSGDGYVGMVVTRHDGKIVWKVDEVRMKWIGKGFGEASRISTAKRAVERNWQRWLDHFGLTARSNPSEDQP